MREDERHLTIDKLKLSDDERKRLVDVLRLLEDECDAIPILAIIIHLLNDQGK